MNALETITTLPAVEGAVERNCHERYRGNAPLSAAIDAWRRKRSEDVHRKVAAASAAVSRKKYREERAAQGLTVRPHTYHDHVPQQPHEHREDYEKRIHRDRERERLGVTAQTVRPYHDLSNMTEEEKAEHRRTQAKLRKANERKRKAEAKDSPIEPNVLEVGYASDPNFGRF